MVSNLKRRNELFQDWKNAKLRLWQYEILKLIKTQNSRQILWVVDLKGNSGISFFSRYLAISYQFQLLDGIISTKDLGPILDRNLKGVAFDVCRANERNFEFGTLEALKNGFLVSAKYAGQTFWLPKIPVVVFANYYPRRDSLSEDRWQVVTLGDEPGNIFISQTEAVVSAEIEFPFVQPPQVPILDERFDLKQYLTENLHQRGNYISSQ